MKINDIVKEDAFGVPTPSPEEIANKHGVDPSIIHDQLRIGIDVEKEHTLDVELAREIALDHLAELPDYYDRLDKMEKR